MSYRGPKTSNLDPVINYISNGRAYDSTIGWATYADAAGAQPVDGTGGSPNVTWSRDTTTPLRQSADFNFVKDAANRQGQGVSYDFTIDNADLAKVITVTFDYEVLSGTYATGDLTVYLIQDPSGTPTVVQPAGYQIQSATVGTKMRQIATFQTSSSVTSYRLCLHVASVSASAYSIAVDNVVLGPQVVQYGAPVTDWQAYTPTTQGFGTITNVDIYWRRVGSDVQVRGSFTTGTVTAAGARVNFPSGLTSTTDTVQDTIIGTYGRGGTTSSHGGFILKQNGASYVGFGPADTFGSTSNSSLSTQLATAVVGSGEKFSFEFFCPILGWSSSVQMSNDTDTRVVDFVGNVTVNQALTSGVTNVTLSTVKDSHGAWSGSSFTVPVPGDYICGGTLFSTANSASSLTVYVNGSLVATLGNFYNTQTGAFSPSLIPNLKAGDVVSFRASNGNFTTLATADGRLHISRLSGPSAIAASETVAARYTTTAGNSIGTSAAAITFATKGYDTHGAFSGSTFTAPVSGKYRASSGLYTAAVALNTAQTVTLYFYKNGALVSRHDTAGNGATRGYNVSGNISIDLLAGETLQVFADINVATTLNTTANYNYVCIERIGN